MKTHQIGRAVVIAIVAGAVAQTAARAQDQTEVLVAACLHSSTVGYGSNLCKAFRVGVRYGRQDSDPHVLATTGARDSVLLERDGLGRMSVFRTDSAEGINRLRAALDSVGVEGGEEFVIRRMGDGTLQADPLDRTLADQVMKQFDMRSLGGAAPLDLQVMPRAPDLMPK